MNWLKKIQSPKSGFLAVSAVMLLFAFIRCYLTTYDLQWGSEPDFDRDIAYIQTILDGHFGQDPNFLGAYMWYNPLLFLIESLIVKLSALPIHIVVIRAGVYLNLLGPVFFFIMLKKLFDYRVATAALLSFLFLASGNLLCWDAATYSPWLFPICFGQFLFYLSVIGCYRAFYTQKMGAFVLLGISTGVTFLGQTAPALILIGMLVIIQAGFMAQAIRQKNYVLLRRYFLQGLGTFIPFIIVSSPILYYVYGKYHLHFVNREIAEFMDPLLKRDHLQKLVRENASVSLVISVIGLIWFYRRFPSGIAKKILFSWLAVSVIMYVYTSLVPMVERSLHLLLPVTVPSFHYFFYMKALQSVFFGFGLVFLLSRLQAWLKTGNATAVLSPWFLDKLLIGTIFLYAVIYLPVYWNRLDFVSLREQSVQKGMDQDKIEVYHYIVGRVPENDVLVCDMETSFFPAMPTARKLVSIGPTFSNPYLDFDRRESDRKEMLAYLKTGHPASGAQLLRDYRVRYFLAVNQDWTGSSGPGLELESVFRNREYTLFRLNY